MNHLAFLREQAAKGGKAGTGQAKARTREQAQSAARKRWKNAKRTKVLLAAHQRFNEIMKRAAMPVAVGYYFGRLEAKDKNPLSNKRENLLGAVAQAEEHWQDFISLSECFTEDCPSATQARKPRGAG